MIIVSPFFARIAKYKKLLNIFYNSGKEKMYNSIFNIIDVKIPKHGYSADTVKNHHWDTYYSFMSKITRAIEIDDNVLMSDSDIMFLQSVNDVWQYDFDIAITIRNYRSRYNTGITFAKPTMAAKNFLISWKQNTKDVAMKWDKKEIHKWAGIDQASLHRTLQEGQNVKILELPCEIWNAEQTCWKHINSETKVIHIKSGLRRIYFGEEKMRRPWFYLRPILERMKHYEKNREYIAFYRSAANRV